MRAFAMVRVAVVGLLCAAVAVLGNKVALACTAFCAVGGGTGTGRQQRGLVQPAHEDPVRSRQARVVRPRLRRLRRPETAGGDERARAVVRRVRRTPGRRRPVVRAPAFPGEHRGRGDGRVRDGRRSRFASSASTTAPSCSEGILMFADASGDAVSIERNAIVRKTGRHFVQTNFHQSLASNPDGRFVTRHQHARARRETPFRSTCSATSSPRPSRKETIRRSTPTSTSYGRGRCTSITSRTSSAS